MDNKNDISKRLGAALKEKESELSPTDKSICKQKFDISDSTLKRYLNGQVADATLAAEMLTFFKEQLAKREAALAA